AVARERASRPIFLDDRHGEIIDPAKTPLNGRARRRSDSDADRMIGSAPAAAAPPAPAPRDPEILQRPRIGHARRDPLQIVSDRMTGAALRREIRAARLSVPDQHALGWHRLSFFRRPPLSLRTGEDAVQVLGNRL